MTVVMVGFGDLIPNQAPVVKVEMKQQQVGNPIPNRVPLQWQWQVVVSVE